MFSIAKRTRLFFYVTLLSLLVGCGGGGGNATSTGGGGTTSTSYTVGVTVSGLTGTGLELEDNGGDKLAITGDGNFTFATPVASGANYNVTVGTQPSSPSQTCAVKGGSGTVASANITGISITCALIAWTWESGSETAGQYGAYGTQGTAAATNVPGAREYALSWTDASGNLWLFGGSGYDGHGNSGYLNDLWKFDGTNWTWVSGNETVNQSGTYSAAGAMPGARESAVSWTDASGNLWLWGGYGYDANGTRGYLNDLWKFDGTKWTWVSGSDIANQPGTYGSQGTAAAANMPGGRDGAVSWIDASGNLWLFGGRGYDSSKTFGYLDDLWKFDGKNWTWVSGTTGVNRIGTYGTQGTAAAFNLPGARAYAVRWIDASGNLWLFGGYGYDANGSGGTLNDLWKFDGKYWTFVSGGSFASRAGRYGTQGTAAATDVPGTREMAMSWTDASGNLWLFGGRGYDSVGNEGDLNDLWKFDGTNWTWVSGSNTYGQTGTYGTQGTAAATNVPGGRENAATWIDTSGRLWLFGGYGYDSGGSISILNDLWRYQP